ncbi:MAG: hypothetical protein SFZ24_10445 [Planctomycetota bacterium]|nr:hypothetical protein [Planctomycetota bacterium]
MAGPFVVDRCVCVNVTFERLREIARTEGADLEGLKDRTGCCSGCGLCEPYIRLMIRTGCTEFAPLSARERAEALRD